MNVDASDRPPAPGTDLTTLLHAWHDGDDGAFAAAIERAYAELKRIAARRIGSDGAATLSATELVHEAVLGTMAAPMDFANRVHFLATMSLAMRSILVDHARARAADKRGGDWLRLSLSRIDAEDEAEPAVDLLALEQALQQLETLDPRCGQILHLAYFGGLAQADIAALLNVSIPTVKRDLRFARACLLKALEHAG